MSLLIRIWIYSVLLHFKVGPIGMSGENHQQLIELRKKEKELEVGYSNGTMVMYLPFYLRV